MWDVWFVDQIICSKIEHLSNIDEMFNIFMNYRIVIATLQLCQTKFKTFEPLIKLIMRIFTSMDNLAKHFLVRIKKVKTAMDSAKFDSLVKHVAKELTPKVYDLITFINDVSDAWQFQIKIIIIVFLRCLFVLVVQGPLK